MKIKGYKLFLWFTLMAVVLMGALAATIVTLASTRNRHVQPEAIGIEAMISLSPTYGGAHTLVNITGIGFPANSRIGLYLAPSGLEPGSQPHGEGLADADGRFSVMFPMPDTWPDGSSVQDEVLVLWAISQGEPARAVAEFDFIPPVIQPEVAITPTRGAAGTPVTVTSSGFPAGARVQLYLAPPDARDLTFVIAEGMTDAAGTLNTTFNMPENWSDGARIKDEQLHIQVAAPDQGVTASAGFDYVPVPYPLITVSPNYGGPRTVVKITGDGYPAGVRVLIKVGTSVEDAAQKPAYLETMADTRGLINLDFTMPGYWPSGLPILVRDVVVLATAADKSGYGWMGFAYLTHAPADPEITPTELNSDQPLVPQDHAPDESTSESESLPEQSQDEPQQPTIEDTDSEVVQPSLTLLPDSGTSNSLVQVIGSGFPANTAVHLFLAIPNSDPEPQSYGEATTDESGNFIASFTMPSTWPDGTAMTAGQIEVVVSTQDLSVLARAIFSYLFTTPSEETP